MPIPAQPPPDDFAQQLRAAVLEAEEHAEKVGGDQARFYAMGLRTAAGLYGMAEGVDPATRARRLADLERVGLVPAFLPDGAVNPAARQQPGPRCYLSSTPNSWGCHDPQCGDSTWDHECPVGPCTIPAHGHVPTAATPHHEPEEQT